MACFSLFYCSGAKDSALAQETAQLVFPIRIFIVSFFSTYCDELEISPRCKQCTEGWMGFHFGIYFVLFDCLFLLLLLCVCAQCDYMYMLMWF